MKFQLRFWQIYMYKVTTIRTLMRRAQLVCDLHSRLQNGTAYLNHLFKAKTTTTQTLLDGKPTVTPIPTLRLTLTLMKFKPVIGIFNGNVLWRFRSNMQIFTEICKRKFEKSWSFCKKGIMYVLWFNFILGVNYISLCLKLIIIHYHTQQQTEKKIKPSIKLDHNIYYRNICYFLDVSCTFLQIIH